MELSIEKLEKYLQGHYGIGTNDSGLFMKLVEELGEVAEILNKKSGCKSADKSDEALLEELGEELADMIHYVVAIAAVHDIDISKVILEKDKRAAVKYGHDIDLEGFLGKTE